MSVHDQSNPSFWNSNSPKDYEWLEAGLEAIVCQFGDQIGAMDEDGNLAVPLFAVAGACPSSGLLAAPMQAIMYFKCGDEIRFW